MNMSNIRIVGYVPVIAHITDGILFCNAANGYDLFIEDVNDNLTKIDSGNGPVMNRQITYVLKSGEQFVIQPRP